MFFTSPEQLTLRDTNRRTDAYEYDPDPEPGRSPLNLISTGTGVTNAALASVSADGKNAFFFTRESIVRQDHNGATMKVYTAREGGGYSYLPEEVPCQAADECRGPGTTAAPAPQIGTYEGTGGNVKQGKRPCGKKAMVRRHGRCVRRRHRRADVKTHRRGRAHRG